MDTNKKAYEQLIMGIQGYVERCLENSNSDKTLTAIVKDEGSREGYKILINNQVYDNVLTIGGECKYNETVNVLVPQGNYNNMIILKGGSGGNGSGGSITNGVTSVNGRKGDIVLGASDVHLGNVTNDKQVKSINNVTENNVVVWGSDGATVKDSGFTIKSNVPQNALFTDTVYDDTAIRNLINAKPNHSDIPKNISKLSNDVGFITNKNVVFYRNSNDDKIVDLDDIIDEEVLIPIVRPNMVWSIQNNGEPIYSSPIVVDGILVYQSWDWFGYVRNVEDGSLVFRRPFSDSLYGAPCVGDINDDGKLEYIFASHAGEIRCYSSDNELLWSQTDVFSSANGDCKCIDNQDGTYTLIDDSKNYPNGMGIRNVNVKEENATVIIDGVSYPIIAVNGNSITIKEE